MFRSLTLTGPLALALALPAAAQEIIRRTDPGNILGEVTAICTAGGGCECTAMVDPESLTVLHGVADAAPEGFAGDVRAQTVVIDRSAGMVYRTARARAEINAAYGGQGDCPVKEPPDAPLVPLDGLWQWRTTGQGMTGCPAILAGALAAARTEAPAARVAWGGRFHPARLADNMPEPEISGMSAYEWRQTGPNRWLSDNIRGRECGDGPCVEVGVTLDMTLVAPERVVGVLSTRSRIEGGEQAILAAFGMADCRVRVRYEIRRIAP
ncbi:hypothetical protein [Rubellimicrobium sp. CFH 75288]|uniref:hypothetical protein n=1 Tax=Rubellimicrobium sp. CFH 75288 TaxID=2697034 RepID=UPI001412D679|nr:hypothetical protein [Rubellimicrobium sp. CFH 75288]NAZ36299.1 hypothetical protein [Rubellimicrobium sp. CFH 75288]